MEIHKKNILEELDEKVCNYFDAQATKNKFRKYKNTYIKKGSWPLDVYKNIELLTEITALPSFNIKKWISFFLKKLKLGKSEIMISDLLGPLLGWFFLKEYSFKIQANSIIDRKNGRILVMIYNRFDVVMKLRPINYNQKFSNEVEGNILAKQVSEKYNILKIPNIVLKHIEINNTSYFLQDLIRGKAIAFCSQRIIAESYKKAADFMFFYYLENGLALKIPDTYMAVTTIKKSKVSDGLYDKLTQLNEKHDNLVKQQKKSFWGKIHGDINIKNLILDKNNDLWLIDWQDTRFDYIVVDLLSIQNSLYLFDKIYNHFSEQRNNLYNFDEQVFLYHYQEFMRKLNENPESELVWDSLNKPPLNLYTDNTI